MSYSLLYYPKFEPDQKWLRSVLLFTDEITRVIPADAEHEDSAQMKQLIEWMPSAIKTVSPTDADKHFDPANMDRLEKVCKDIYDSNAGGPTKSVTFTISESGGVSVKGNVWISRAKLSPNVLHILAKYNLSTEVNMLRDHPPLFGGMMPINEEVSNIIVSYIADQIAKRTGTDTITDLPIPHAVQSLDTLHAVSSSVERENEGLLLAAIANLAVPARIELMSFPDFQELRQSFSEIREPFHEFVLSLAAHRRLGRQDSAAAAEKRIEQAVRDYQKQMQKFRSHRVSRAVDEWTPVAIGGLLMIWSQHAPP